MEATSLPAAGAGLMDLALAAGAAVIGIVALAAGISGFFKAELATQTRVLMLIAAALLLAPDLGGERAGLFVNIAGAVLFVVVATWNWRVASRSQPDQAPSAT